jgi:hypothetical protein
MIKREMSLKKKYTKPEVARIELDNSICLMMITTTPPNPDPRGGGSGSKGAGDPFQSPFGDKPFS